MNVRTVAAQVLVQVIPARGEPGVSLTEALAQADASVGERDRALLHELCFGVCRWNAKLEALAAQLLQKPLKNKDRDIHFLILLGLYQMFELRVPDHAAISSTVEGARELDKEWAVRLINGVLRNAQREKETLLAKLPKKPEVEYSHPAWLVQAIQKDWPSQANAILEANNGRAPMTLRVNKRRSQRDEYLRLLAEYSIGAQPCEFAPYGIQLDKPVGVDKLPGFADGVVSVQDESGQLLAGLVELKDGMRVLDACAAPGSKTGLLLEQAEIAMTALDIDASRAERIHENIQRLGFNAEVNVADASALDAWWDKLLFDVIVLDAPCSATGVIRRHPDSKWLRRPSDIAQFSTIQLQLLSTLWETLAPGGALVYSTCSVLQAENARVIQKFLGEHADAQEKPITAAWGEACTAGRQLFPQPDGHDGFYFCVLTKRAG